MKAAKIGLIKVIALGALVALTPLARAEDAPEAKPKRPAIRERAQDRLKVLAEKLGLSDEQKEKLRGILSGETEQLRALRADASLTPEQKREKVRGIRQDVAAKVKECLTPEQHEKWLKLREEARDRRAGDKGEKGEKQEK